MEFLVEMGGKKVDLRELRPEERKAWIDKVSTLEARVWLDHLITALGRPRAFTTLTFEAFMKEVAEAAWAEFGIEHVACPTLVYEQPDMPEMTPKDYADAVGKRIEEWKASGLLKPMGPNESRLQERLDQKKLKPGETTDLLRRIAVGIDSIGVAGSTPAETSTVAGSRMPEGEWGVGAQPQSTEDSRKSLQLFKEAEERVHFALHRAWTNYVGTEKYDKTHWKELLAAIEDQQLKHRVLAASSAPPPPPADPGATRILELATKEAEAYGMIRGVESLREFLGGYLPTIHSAMKSLVTEAAIMNVHLMQLIGEDAAMAKIAKEHLSFAFLRLSGAIEAARHFTDRPLPPKTAHARIRAYVKGLGESDSAHVRDIASTLASLLGDTDAS